MLSAEHYALESAAVQHLLKIREAEVTYYKDRFDSIALQSTLIVALTVQTVTSVDALDHSNIYVRVAFWWFSALSFSCSLFCIVTATFGQVWGPGLALRGPKGSVLKAYHAMKQENSVVMKAYLGQIFFFILLFTLIFEIGDTTANYHWPAMVGGCIIFSAGIYTLLRLRAMKLRLSYDKSVTEGLEEHWDNGEARKLAVSRSSYRTNAKTFLFGKSDNDQKKKKTTMVNLNKKDELGKGLLANDHLSTENINTNNNNKVKKRRLHNGPLAFEGELKKRGRMTGKIMGNRGKWISRYFILKGDIMYEFHDKIECEKVLEGSNGILDHKYNKNVKYFSLKGYEILVDVRSEIPSLVFSPLDNENSNNLPVRYYRATDDMFRDWAKHLVSASLTSQGDDDGSYIV